MSFGSLLLIIAAILVFCGLLQRVLDRMYLTDRGALLLVMLMFIPAFGNGTDFSGTVSLFGLTGISSWVRIVFIVIISIAILNGICGVIHT